MDPLRILRLRFVLDFLICSIWTISSTISTFLALEPCDVTSQIYAIHNILMLVAPLYGLSLEFFSLHQVVYYNPSIFESHTWYFSITRPVVLVKVLTAILMEIVNRLLGVGEVWKIDRLFQYDTISRRINGTYDFEYCFDPREPPRCTAIAPRLLLTILELIVALIVLELIIFLVVYLIVRWKSRKDPSSRGCKLFETHRESISFHRQIDFDRDAWIDHDELIRFMTEFADDDRDYPMPEWRQFIATVPLIDLNTTSNGNDIDRLIYSLIVFKCGGRCESDDGIYLSITSELLRKCRLVKLSPTLPTYDFYENAKVLGFVQDGRAMCVFESNDDEYDDINENARTKFLLYDPRDDSRREFDVSSTLDYDDGCFWCLNDDGRDMGAEINKEATYVRIIYGCKPTNQFNVGFAIRHSLLEIPRGDGEIKTKQLQEIKYRSNWRFTNRNRLIRTSRGHVGVIGELIDSNMTMAEDGDGLRWSTCVVYSLETRRLSATGDYERYLEVDRTLRKYFDRTVDEYESLGFVNVHKMHRFDRMFLCPQVLTDTRAIDVLVDDGSIRSIDFAPRSLKWLCLRKFVDAYGKDFYKNRATGWGKLTGVDLDKHFWE